MKYVPNILTFSRIILALILLCFCHTITPEFIAIFVMAMATDLFDGAIARKFDVTSQTGALLDSIADFLLDANLIKIVFTMKVISKKQVIWMIISLCIGILSPIINWMKHQKLFFIHSIACKICMWLLLGIPFSIILGFASQYIIITLSFITFAMLELVIISMMLKEVDPDVTSAHAALTKNRNLNSTANLT